MKKLSLSMDTVRQFVKVVISGGASTLVYFALLNVLRFGAGWTSFWSVTGAFAVATATNYLLNRGWSFRLGLRVNPSETAAFYVTNVAAWGLTVLIVLASEKLFGPLGPIGLNVTNVFADAVLIVPKFLAYKKVVFRRSLLHHGDSEDAAHESGGAVAQSQSLPRRLLPRRRTE